jgi:hypothetical protein
VPNIFNEFVCRSGPGFGEIRAEPRLLLKRTKFSVENKINLILIKKFFFDLQEVLSSYSTGGSKIILNLFISILEAYRPSRIQIWIRIPNPDQDQRTQLNPATRVRTRNIAQNIYNKDPVNTWASSITILKFFGFRN